MARSKLLARVMKWLGRPFIIWKGLCKNVLCTKKIYGQLMSFVIPLHTSEVKETHHRLISIGRKQSNYLVVFISSLVNVVALKRAGWFLSGE